jgi:hypothetical protein
MPSNELEVISVLLNVMFIMQQYMNLLADEENLEAEYHLAQEVAMRNLVQLQLARLTTVLVCSSIRQIYPRSIGFYRKTFLEGPDNRFKKKVRMGRGAFADLCERLEPRLRAPGNAHRPPYETELFVAACLNRLGSRSELHDISDKWGIGTSTLSVWTDKFIEAVIEELKNEISFPPIWSRRRHEIQCQFQEKTSRPGVPGVSRMLGAVDGSHIPLERAPTEDHKAYFDRKQRYSLLVQAVSDIKGRFLDFSAAAPGSYHDARLLRLTNLFAVAKELFCDEVCS